MGRGEEFRTITRCSRIFEVGATRRKANVAPFGQAIPRLWCSCHLSEKSRAFIEIGDIIENWFCGGRNVREKSQHRCSVGRDGVRCHSARSGSIMCAMIVGAWRSNEVWRERKCCGTRARKHGRQESGWLGVDGAVVSGRKEAGGVLGRLLSRCETRRAGGARRAACKGCRAC